MRKKIWSIASAILMFMLLANSCRQEQVMGEIHTERSNAQRFIVERKNYAEFQKQKDLIDQLKFAEQKLLSRSQSALGKYENNTFNVNLADALYIEDTSNGNHSYIFRIDDNDPSSFDLENLVLKPNSANGYDAFLVTYTLTQSERQAIANGHNVDVSHKTTLQTLDSGNINVSAKSGSTCYELVIYGETDCTCHTTHAPGGCTHPDTLYEWVQVSCGSGGGGSSGPGGDTGGTSPGNGGGIANPETGPVSTGDPGILITPEGEIIDPPCEKTKALLAKPEVAAKIQELKEHTGSNEKGYKFMKDGTPPQLAPPGTDNHSVYLGDPSLLQGYHHTHPNLGMFSATDINNLINISRYITAGGSGLTINDAWVGIIGPGGVQYIIRYTGSFSDLQQLGIDYDKVKEWDRNQLSRSIDFIQNYPNFSETVNGKTILNDKGREALFYDTINRMGLSNNIITLQEVDQNESVSKIKQNPDGVTTAVPCP